MSPRIRLRQTTPILAVIILLASSCQPTADAPAPEAPEAPRATARPLNMGGFLGFADIGPDDGGGVPSAADIEDWMSKIEDIQDYVRDYNECAEQGFGTEGCTAKDMFWKGVCILFAWQVGNILIWDPGIPFEELCNGEPPLKCCKYEPATQESCHTAFNNDDDPLNCEGNPYMPFADSYGECIPRKAFPGDIGCYCDYIPQCASPVVDRPEAAPWRYNHLGVRLAWSIEESGPIPLIREKPQAFVDYVSFVGFRAHRQVFREAAPFAKPDEFPPGYPLSEGYHASDNIPEARYLRALTTLAVQRVFAGIPNLKNRWNAIASRSWTEQEKADWLANVPNPEGVLEACVGTFGVDMLRRAFPETYLLLAAPLAGETQPSCPAGWVGGAAIGAAPSLSVTVSAAGATATLVPTVVDPNASDNPEGTYAVQLDWGDGRVEGRAYGVSTPSSHAMTHTYEAAGTYTVTARIINTSGLVGEATAQVTVAQGSGQPVRRSVESVQFDLEASVTADAHGRIRVDVEGTDAQGKVHSLGYHWVQLTGATGTHVTVPLTSALANGSLKDLQSLRLKPSHYDGDSVSLRMLRLSGVTLNLYASPGMQPESRAYVLTNQDVKVYAAGATTPTAPLMEAGTGKLELPLMNAEIVIDLSSTSTPDPALSYGCRPVHGPDAPLMRTAGGGCEDIASGLVFAVIPHRSNWHAAVWDSAVAGSPAPDANDYGRLNDYPGGFPATGPDTSAAAYCHDLTQGGFSDWRLPTDDELLKVAGAARAGTYFPYSTTEAAWTATSVDATRAFVRNLQTGSRSNGEKATGSYLVVCVRSAPPPAEHACLVPADGEQTFVSGSGGCMDTRAGGLVWSRASVSPRTWHAAVWGSELAGNAQPDAHDGPRANDYAGASVPDSPDASVENYCHELVEGGFSDWRLPTEVELRAVRGDTLAVKYFAFKAEHFWSSATSASLTNTSLSVNLDTGLTGNDAQTAYRRVVCVRAPASMVAPDLAPTGFTGPSTAVTDQPVSFTWTITNQGTQDAAPSWRDAIYLSSDTHPSHDDTPVTDATRSTLLAAGASYTVTKSAPLPGVPAGNYFLLLRTDSTRVVVEKNDGNNGWTALPITVTNPDLAVTAFSGPSAAEVKETVSFSWTVTNPSAATAHPNWNDAVYLSTDATYGSEDTSVTSQSRTAALAPGASYTVTRSAALPSVPAGNYFLLFRTDHNGGLYESDETNNGWTALPITVTTADLVPGGLTAPTSARAGTSITLTWSVSNGSTSVDAHPSWADYVYLSSDTACCSGDTSLTNATRSTVLAPGTGYSVTKTVTLPATLTPGSYNLILSVDRNNALGESDEGNNLVSVPFTVEP